jgi:hypothetical protein
MLKVGLLLGGQRTGGDGLDAAPPVIQGDLITALLGPGDLMPHQGCGGESGESLHARPVNAISNHVTESGSIPFDGFRGDVPRHDHRREDAASGHHDRETPVPGQLDDKGYQKPGGADAGHDGHEEAPDERPEQLGLEGCLEAQREVMVHKHETIDELGSVALPPGWLQLVSAKIVGSVVGTAVAPLTIRQPVILPAVDIIPL